MRRNDNGGPPLQDRPRVAVPQQQDSRLIEAQRLERGARSKLALARDHDARANEFIINPTVRPDMEGRSAQEIRRQQQARVNHLRDEAAEFRRQAAADMARARRLREEAGQ